MSEEQQITNRRRDDNPAIEKLYSKLYKLKEDMDGITLSMSKQELLRENTDIRIAQVMKAAHKRIDDLSGRLGDIIDNQNNTGCQVLQRSEAIRKEKMKAYDKEIDIAKEERQGIRDYVEKIKDLPNKILFRVIVSIATAGVLGIIAFYQGR